jgi:hypothetical protein
MTLYYTYEYIDDTAICTTLVKINSKQCYCEAELDENFHQQNFYL